MERTPGGIYQDRLRKKKQDLIREYKSARGCAECGERDWVVLDLDHIVPSSKHLRLRNGTRTGGHAWLKLSFENIAAELEKCQVLCANCHRRRTFHLRHHSTGSGHATVAEASS